MTVASLELTDGKLLTYRYTPLGQWTAYLDSTVFRIEYLSLKNITVDSMYAEMYFRLA